MKKFTICLIITIIIVFKIYFKQAMQMLKKNKFMSIIAILGTALAIMMIMTIIVAEEIKNVSVAPEINRYRTYYISRQIEKDTAQHHTWHGNIMFEMYKQCLQDLKTPAYTSPYFVKNERLQIEGMPNREEGLIKYTNTDYFKIISLPFIAGRAFTEEEFNSGIKCAIITQGMARKLMKDENPLERTLILNKRNYRIIGVVKDISSVFRAASSDIWAPYTSRENNTGWINFMMMAKDNKDYPAIYEEIREREQKFNHENVPKVLSFIGPSNHRINSMNFNANSEEDEKERVAVESRKKWFIIAILLLIPAINLSGFSFSRIKKRRSEIGVRKAFGAKKYIILIQVLYENFITSVIGGVLGLVCSYIIIIRMKDWLLNIPAEHSVPVNTLVSPLIFITVFILCLLLNLLSAGVPAWRASRVSITNSLNQNDN